MNSKLTPQDILHEIAQIQRMERGKLCVLREGPNGPYHNCQCWEKGKNVSHYVPREEVAACQEAIAGYQRFHQLTEQYAQQIVDRTRAELAGSAKKNKSRRKSSSPRTPKSSN